METEEIEKARMDYFRIVCGEEKISIASEG